MASGIINNPVIMTDTSIAGITAKRYGEIVTVDIAINTVITETSGGKWHTIGTLPASFRPKETIRTTLYDNDVYSFATSNMLLGMITNTGAISIYVFSDHLSMKPYGTVTYLVV